MEASIVAVCGIWGFISFFLVQLGLLTDSNVLLALPTVFAVQISQMLSVDLAADPVKGMVILLFLSVFMGAIIGTIVLLPIYGFKKLAEML